VLDRLVAEGEGSELANAWGEMGRLYHAYRLDDAAAACYRNALALAPSDFRLRYYLGQLLLQTGDTAAAVEQLERAVRLRPRDVPARVALGRLYLTLDRLDEAEEQLDAALAEQPRHAVARFALAQLASDRGDAAAAVRHLEAAFEAQPTASGLHYPLALAYRALGDTERAARHFEQRGDLAVSMEDPLMSELVVLGVGTAAHLEAGAVAFRKGDFAEAAAAFGRAVESDPDHGAARQNLAAALVKLGDAPGAEAQFREALRIDPESFAASYNLGLLLERLRRYDEARAALGAALRRDPAHVPARLHLADSARKGGDCGAALGDYAALLAGEAGPAEAALGAARCEVALGRPAAALARLEAALERDPEDDRLAAAVARVLATAEDAAVRDGSRAVTIAERILARARSLDNVQTAAMAHAAAGDFARAVALQQAALDAVVGAGRTDLAAPLRAVLARYRAGEGEREPWPAE
jgi:tetratricopeptide (TPR) repeat protein